MCVVKPSLSWADGHPRQTCVAETLLDTGSNIKNRSYFGGGGEPNKLGHNWLSFICSKDKPPQDIQLDDNSNFKF